jgi:hypothetical protein
MFKQLTTKRAFTLVLTLALYAGILAGCSKNNGESQHDNPNRNDFVDSTSLDEATSTPVGNEVTDESQDEGEISYGLMTTHGQSGRMYPDASVLTQLGDVVTLDVEVGTGASSIVAIYDLTDDESYMNSEFEATTLMYADIAEQDDFEQTENSYIINYYSGGDKSYNIADNVVCFAEVNDHSAFDSGEHFVCSIEELLEPIYNGYDFKLYVENDEVVVIHADYDVEAAFN